MATDRFDTTGVTGTMKAVVTTGTGGYDRLVIRDVPLPVPGAGAVLIKVAAAGVNNTDINTRLGWYSPDVRDGTDQMARAGDGAAEQISAGGWKGSTPFPLIQGTDCCGEIVETGPGVARTRIGERVLVRPCMRVHGFQAMETRWMAADFDGAFAQFVVVPATEAFAVNCNWTAAELASIPCAYGTAENMLHRSSLKSGERVLITGASGGVGSAAIQLAKRRGAHIIAVAGRDKMDAVAALGCDMVLARGEDLVATLGTESIDLVVDNVAGPDFPTMLKVLRRGGRYVSSGAIAGPVVTLDMRDLYLKDITLFGSTAWDEPVFRNLIGYIERGEIRPLVAKCLPLADIVLAQKEFIEKRHIGKFVLLPPI